MISRSRPRQAWDRARETGVILASHDTLAELGSVLHRPKLAGYLSLSEITVFLAELARVVELVAITQRITLCRDPRDDKFLELAIAGRADFLVTGDVDLLTLDPFHGTAIMDPATYLGRP